MSDLAQDIQQAEDKDSETTTDTQTGNSEQDILGNTAVLDILGFSDTPPALEGSARDVYMQHAERTPAMMVGLTQVQQIDMEMFLRNWSRNRNRYEEVSQATNMPAELIAALHWRESSANFNTYLHQGDPLGRPAVNIPNNIPVFYEWEEAAKHALNMDYHKNRQEDLEINQDTQNPNALATYAETYNGLGYFQRGVPSPYVYSGTDQYMSGKYVADGQYRSGTVDQQIGVMPLLGALDAIQTPQDMSPKAINADFAWSRVANGSKVLRKGDYGLEIEALQSKLQQLGYNINSIDGDFGNKTRQEVIQFQGATNQVQDGIVGRNTATSIDDALKTPS